MTDSPPPHPRPPLPPRQGGSGCAAALMILAGILLLLPGLCALVFVGYDPKDMLTNPAWLLLVLMCMAIAAGGVALIRAAIKLD